MYQTPSSVEQFMSDFWINGECRFLALNHFLQVARGLLTSKLREPLTKNGSPENGVSELKIGNKCFLFLFKI